MKNVLLFLTISILSFGCASADKTKTCNAKSSIKSYLANTTWQPSFLVNQGDTPMPEGGNDGVVFLNIDENLKVNGMSGDNLFGGDIIVGEDGSFDATKLFSTKRMGRFGDYEMKFLKALTSANRIDVSPTGNTILILKDGDINLEFKKIQNKQPTTMENKNSVTVFAGLRVKDGTADKFIEMSKDLIANTRKEIGCLKYDLTQDVSDPCVFYFYEEYTSMDAFKLHAGSAYLAKFRELREPIVDKNLGLKILQEVK